MGLLKLVGSKFGSLLSHGGAHDLRRHSSHFDPSNTHQDPDPELEKEHEQSLLRRSLSESDCREEFHGPDTTSLSAFLYSFFSTSDSGRSIDDRSVSQSPDEAKSQIIAGLIPEVRSNVGKDEASACASDENLEKLTPEVIAGEKSSNVRLEDHDLEEADWDMVSDQDVGNLMISGSRHPKPANLITPKLPSMSETSSLLSEALQQFLFLALPTLARGRQWTLIYSTQLHGISLLTLYRRSGILSAPYLLVTGDTKGAVFGGLLPVALKPTPSKKYQGTSETFVFTDVSGKPELYRPTGLNRYYVLCTNDALAFGGGSHFALHLDNDLLTGSSGACATFGNSCLAYVEDFVVKNVELWGFSHSSRYTSQATSFEEPKEAPGLCRW